MSITRRGVLGLGLAASAVGLGACARGTETSDSGTDGASVSLNADRADFEPGYEAANAVLAEKGAPKIQARNVPTVDNYQQIIRTSLGTDSTTDMIKWWSGYRIKDLAREGGLADISEAWQHAESNGWINPDSKESYSQDGKVYGLPLYRSFWVVFYNKTVFADAGIKPPTTWAEFLSNNDKLKSADVTPLFGTQSAGWTSFIWFEELLTKTDPEFYVRLMNNEAKWTDSTVVDTLRLWAELYERGHFTKADVSWDTEPALLKEGKVAQTMVGTWRNGQFSQTGMTPDVYGAYLLPAVEESVKPSVITESGLIAVAAKAKNQEGAKEVAKLWMDPEVQSAWVNVIKDTSANPEVTNEDPVLADIVAQVQDVQPMELERFWEAGPPAFIEGSVQHLGAFMANPTEANIQPTVDKIQQLNDSEWAKWEKQG